MNDPDARRREILEGGLRGTPLEGDEGQMRRLLELSALGQIAVVAIVAGGYADSVDGALEDFRERGEFIADVERDLEDL